VTAVLAARGLVAGYGGIPVVHGVDLDVAAGEVVSLLGANGAGKTTLLLTVSGLLTPIDGTLEVLGEAVPARRRVRASTVTARARLGLAHVPEDRGLFADLTAREHFRLGSRRAGRSGGQTLDLDEVLGWFPALARVLDRRAGLLSGGEQQMLSLARAVVGAPRLLLVDELSLGLAPMVVEQILPSLRTIAGRTGAGVVVVEQHVGLALAVSDRAYVLGHGRVLAAGTSAEVASQAEVLEAGYLGGVPDTGDSRPPGESLGPAD
jgi:branched-chain amino acid transport system ATP-binding protein